MGKKKSRPKPPRPAVPLPTPAVDLLDSRPGQKEIEYPIWNGSISLHLGGREIIGPSVSQEQSIPFSEVVRVFQAMEHAGRLSPWREEERGMSFSSSEVMAYVRELQAKGADGNRLLRMLCGLDPGQRVSLPFLVNTVMNLRYQDDLGRRRNAELLRLWRRYRGVWKLALQDDALLRATTREALLQDLNVIGLTLALLRAPRLNRPLRKAGISVRPTRNLSRQAFWTRPMVALVDYLRPILGSSRAAYRATARLLYLAFGYPDEPNLVERRVLHHRQRPN